MSMVSVCRCSECGTRYEGIDKFCPQCGEKIFSVIRISEEEYEEVINGNKKVKGKSK